MKFSEWKPRPKKFPQPKRQKTQPADPIPARIVWVESGGLHSSYPSHSAANKVLAKLIKGLKIGAPHTYRVEDDI
jgi:hypothetical protein